MRAPARPPPTVKPTAQLPCLTASMAYSTWNSRPCGLHVVTSVSYCVVFWVGDQGKGSAGRPQAGRKRRHATRVRARPRGKARDRRDAAGSPRAARAVYLLCPRPARQPACVPNSRRSLLPSSRQNRASAFRPPIGSAPDCETFLFSRCRDPRAAGAGLDGRVEAQIRGGGEAEDRRFVYALPLRNNTTAGCGRAPESLRTKGFAPGDCQDLVFTSVGPGTGHTSEETIRQTRCAIARDRRPH
jgi:hypothetical protein